MVFVTGFFACSSSAQAFLTPSVPGATGLTPLGRVQPTAAAAHNEPAGQKTFGEFGLGSWSLGVVAILTAATARRSAKRVARRAGAGDFDVFRGMRELLNSPEAGLESQVQATMNKLKAVTAEAERKAEQLRASMEQELGKEKQINQELRAQVSALQEAYGSTIEKLEMTEEQAQKTTQQLQARNAEMAAIVSKVQLLQKNVDMLEQMSARQEQDMAGLAVAKQQLSEELKSMEATLAQERLAASETEKKFEEQIAKAMAELQAAKGKEAQLSQKLQGSAMSEQKMVSEWKRLDKLHAAAKKREEDLLRSLEELKQTGSQGKINKLEDENARLASQLSGLSQLEGSEMRMKLEIKKSREENNRLRTQLQTLRGSVGSGSKAGSSTDAGMSVQDLRVKVAAMRAKVAA